MLRYDDTPRRLRSRSRTPSPPNVSALVGYEQHEHYLLAIFNIQGTILGCFRYYSAKTDFQSVYSSSWARHVLQRLGCRSQLSKSTGSNHPPCFTAPPTHPHHISSVGHDRNLHTSASAARLRDCERCCNHTIQSRFYKSDDGDPGALVTTQAAVSIVHWHMGVASRVPRPCEIVTALSPPAPS